MDGNLYCELIVRLMRFFFYHYGWAKTHYSLGIVVCWIRLYLRLVSELNQRIGWSYWRRYKWILKWTRHRHRLNLVLEARLSLSISKGLVVVTWWQHSLDSLPNNIGLRVTGNVKVMRCRDRLICKSPNTTSLYLIIWRVMVSCNFAINNVHPYLGNKAFETTDRLTYIGLGFCLLLSILLLISTLEF